MPRVKQPRAAPVAPRITREMVGQIKGMLGRGDRQSDIASFFQINQGRIYEVKFGKKYAHIPPSDQLPERGPYVVVSRVRHERASMAEAQLQKVLAAVEAALRENA